MSTDIKTPHPMFLAVWSFVYVGVCYAHIYVVGPYPWGAIGWLVGLMVFEVLAAVTNWRWTLSAVITWVIRSRSKHVLAFQGWNWLVEIFTLPIMLLLLRAIIGLVAGPWGWVIGLVVTVPGTWMLHQHFLRPDVHG